jgi:hypothetical protein
MRPFCIPITASLDLGYDDINGYYLSSVGVFATCSHLLTVADVRKLRDLFSELLKSEEEGE